MRAPDLVTAELTLTGRLTTASNAIVLGSIGDTAVVCKPIAGVKPRRMSGDREVAAYLVSEVVGWNIVPHIWLRDGPSGEGMVQLWQETDPGQAPVDLVPADDLPESGWKEVLRRMAVFGGAAHSRGSCLVR